jgi:hypothetical protein
MVCSIVKSNQNMNKGYFYNYRYAEHLATRIDKPKRKKIPVVIKKGNKVVDFLKFIFFL